MMLNLGEGVQGELGLAWGLDPLAMPEKQTNKQTNKTKQKQLRIHQSG